jgi:hypothetical protein
MPFSMNIRKLQNLLSKYPKAASSFRIGADNASEVHLRELAALAEKLSTVSSTLRERPPVAVEVSVV